MSVLKEEILLNRCGWGHTRSHPEHEEQSFADGTALEKPVGTRFSVAISQGKQQAGSHPENDGWKTWEADGTALETVWRVAAYKELLKECWVYQ